MDTARFYDFDDPENFSSFMTQARSYDSRNFVLEFNTSEAKCAFDVGADGFRTLLEARAAESAPYSNTRWINVWRPEAQLDTLKLLGKAYGFSPRLLLSMCSHPRRSIAPSSKPTHQHRNYQDYLHWRQNRDNHLRQRNTPSKASSHNDTNAITASTPTPPVMGDINHYKIASEVWHFASVDWGHRFTCIGFNSIYQSPGSTTMPDERPNSNKPAGKRIWAWLVLCDDNTVISIHENPYPDGRGYTNDELLAIRHNLLNVFKQLSKTVDKRDPPNPIMTVHIRPGLHHTNEGEARIEDKDSPSLLYYYLFDDWYTTYSLVARSEHQYGTHLERTREEMFRVADIKNINQLHHYGRQLSVLKRIYQSYIMLIERTLRGPKVSQTQVEGDQELDGEGSNTVATTEARTRSAAAYGVLLSTSASVRFERLKDRITLYALNEIQDCLDEKDALVMLNFNLIALRESSYVEKLTRITILLAKVTILFIPVSLMSTYFTVPFGGVSDAYTPTVYWVAFAVVFALSVVVLMIFGQLSGTQEGKPVYRSLTRVGFEAWKTFFGKKGKEVLDDEEEGKEIRVSEISQ